MSLQSRLILSLLLLLDDDILVFNVLGLWYLAFERLLGVRLDHVFHMDVGFLGALTTSQYFL